MCPSSGEWMNGNKYLSIWGGTQALQGGCTYALGRWGCWVQLWQIPSVIHNHAQCLNQPTVHFFFLMLVHLVSWYICSLTVNCTRYNSNKFSSATTQAFTLKSAATLHPAQAVLRQQDVRALQNSYHKEKVWRHRGLSPEPLAVSLPFLKGSTLTSGKATIYHWAITPCILGHMSLSIKVLHKCCLPENSWLSRFKLAYLWVIHPKFIGCRVWFFVQEQVAMMIGWSGQRGNDGGAPVGKPTAYSAPWFEYKI